MFDRCIMAMPHVKNGLLKFPGDRNREMDEGHRDTCATCGSGSADTSSDTCWKPRFFSSPPYLLCGISQQVQKSDFGLSRLAQHRNTEQTPVVCPCAGAFPAEQSSLEWPRTPRSAWHKGQRDALVCASWLSLTAFILLRAQERGFSAASAFS